MDEKTRLTVSTGDGEKLTEHRERRHEHNHRHIVNTDNNDNDNYNDEVRFLMRPLTRFFYLCAFLFV